MNECVENTVEQMRRDASVIMEAADFLERDGDFEWRSENRKHWMKWSEKDILWNLNNHCYEVRPVEKQKEE